jgi:hypothetical protein
MKYKLLFVFLAVSLSMFSQAKNDSTEIIKLLINDYTTMGNWDIKTHLGNITDNYLLLEDGEIWDIKKETEYYTKNVSRVIDRKDFFDIKYVRIYGNSAYAAYNLKSDITENGVLKIKTWLESVIFRKINGNWKIELIHSTAIQATK